ncbi:hypothetical protein QUF99_12400 [Bacillus sp. DX4.1]|uniref:hypothetical protein n=1 Tax=Bacillus sp. DX4.1 TaxID=3055867 RepID=UPI0025A08AFA|nr:hypothetical protein [Bacillus sp. DX4.1]MDM5188092.1 hypothetical protein [Bacillus sp. DX4.1]
MNKTITQSKRVTAEQLIMKDLMNAFIAEQFFHIDEHTTKMLSTVPNVIQNLYLESEQALIYIDELCFLVEKSYRQGYQWVSGSSIY